MKPHKGESKRALMLMCYSASLQSIAKWYGWRRTKVMHKSLCKEINL
jgi:hypothetical protein